MKDILISVKPKFCEKIANGEKTIEVRKTKPKIETPFKCYIYCTNGTQLLDIKKERIYLDTNKSFLLTNEKSNKVICSTPPQANSKIIGEFICDRITKYQYERCAFGEHLIPYDDFEQIGMDSWELYDYLRVEDGYGWHISELEIYDEPKELSKFNLTRPPRSWCYVEELSE